MMTKKKVLIIEDETSQRESIHYVLKQCGFEVYSEGNVADARRTAKLHWDELDVAVLDMRLNDPNEPQITGADIGIEFRKKKKGFPPETIIYSAYAEIDYYRLALQLGAAAYLSKAEENLLNLIMHVRVLALRRALNGENPKTATAIAQIAVQSKSQSEAIMAFCRRILKPEFDSCLGAPFMILFTEGDETKNCADNAALPAGSSTFYHTLQALAHGKGNLTEPFILEASELETPLDGETALLYERLNRAAFLPLSLSNNLRLSICILQEQENEDSPRPTDAKTLCKVLAQYLRPTVLENIINIWLQWSEVSATRTSTARLCLSVGQEIKDSIEQGELKRLKELADDLNDTGQLLFQIENRDWQNESEAVSVGQVVTTAWNLVAGSEDDLTLKPDLQEDCMVRAQRNDLEIIFSRLLQWFTYRKDFRPFEAEPLISVKGETTPEGVSITFEDNSYRLPKKLREDMFAPFTQAISTPFASIDSAMGTKAETSAKNRSNTGRYLPLYLAKMLVEGRYHGLLQDKSDEIEQHSYGHRILMRFPANKVDGV
jgi:DNA-binding NarL/FixJ family response regulator